MANELGAAATFLVQKLSADSGVASYVNTRIFSDFAPEPTSTIQDVYPFVVFNHMSTLLRTFSNRKRICADMLFSVRMHGKSGYGAISGGADAIDAALDRVTDTIVYQGVPYNVTCDVERTIQSSELDNGIRYSYRGSIVRLRVYVP